MFFLVPVSHESMTARRWPWVTTSIVALNLIVHVTLLLTANTHELDQVGRRALDFHVAHPKLAEKPPLDRIERALGVKPIPADPHPELSEVLELSGARPAVEDDGVELQGELRDRVRAGSEARAGDAEQHVAHTTRIRQRLDALAGHDPLFRVNGLSAGYGNKEIAVQLALSPKTVEAHKANAMRKLDLSGRIDIVKYAVLQGWLDNT